MITPIRAKELYRDFVRSRQNAFLGWPSPEVYNENDLKYFDTLEQERLAGRIEIEGKIMSIDDYPVPL